MQRRKKIGGILDRRFGENDTSMTPEEKALERFVKEKQKKTKKGSLFDLEDGEEDDQLTHFGESLSFNQSGRVDDFNEADLDGSGEELSNEYLTERPRKRRKLSDTNSSGEESLREGDGVRPERPKTKKEVMDEVIAKSKLYKYERQQAKEDDDGLRAELDKGLPDIFALMRGNSRVPPQQPEVQTDTASMNPDRMALLNGKDRSQADKEYDERLRQMAMDQRAKPTVRTLTDEEKVQKEAERLKELETKRLRRMRGEPEDSDSDTGEKAPDMKGDEDPDLNEADAFGLGPGLNTQPQNRELDVEDEDDFLIESSLVASGSELDLSEDDEPNISEGDSSDDDDREFVQGLLSKDDAGREGLCFSKDRNGIAKASLSAGDLAYTYKCPETHEELLTITNTVAIENLPTVVQRIRALYHPKLASENKTKLSGFAVVLVDHISYLACRLEHPPFTVLEALIRHIHSLAKTFPEEIGRAFRSHLRSFHQERPTVPTPGDLIILTAISTIFPTSDHFHQVVTPAMLCMTRYLAQKAPHTVSDLAIGAYISTLCLQYQSLSRRYIPEVVTYAINAVSALAPVKPRRKLGSLPKHNLPESLRLRSTLSASEERERLSFWNITTPSDSVNADDQALKILLLNTNLTMLETMAEMWADKAAFCEVFDPVYSALRFLTGIPCSGKLNGKLQDRLQQASNKIHHQLQKSLSSRAPLRLHNHRPLAIKTSIPKFEESYNPDKHYDPDRDRAEMSKLKAEHKRERKGALRELRKDANFVARESLREKKERDSAYEKKFKRLVAEIQGEEGREAKGYEREKRMRKGNGKGRK